MKRYKLILSSIFCIVASYASSSEQYNIDTILKTYGKEIRNATYPDGIQPCTEEDIIQLKTALSIKTVPSQLNDFFLKFSHLSYRAFEIVMPQHKFQEYTVSLITEAWEAGVPTEYLPFCGDNANYYCIHLDTGAVRFWAHDRGSFSDSESDQWDSFYNWVQTCWVPLMDRKKINLSGK